MIFADDLYQRPSCALSSIGKEIGSQPPSFPVSDLSRTACQSITIIIVEVYWIVSTRCTVGARITCYRESNNTSLALSFTQNQREKEKEKDREKERCVFKFATSYLSRVKFERTVSLIL